MFYFLYKHQWNAKPFHLNIILFAAKVAIYNVAMTSLIFSHVKNTMLLLSHPSEPLPSCYDCFAIYQK